MGACQRTGSPAPVTTGISPNSAGGAVIVEKGDSLYTLSRRYEVPLRDLIAANNLSPPYTIEPGQRLILPAARQYIVKRGDTLSGIAKMFGVDSSELTRLNSIPPPYNVQVGQPLRLPGGNGGGEPTSLAAAPAAAVRRGAVESVALPPPGASAPPRPEPARTEPNRIDTPPPAPHPAAGGKPESKPLALPAGQRPTPAATPATPTPGTQPHALKPPAGRKPAEAAQSAPAADAPPGETPDEAPAATPKLQSGKAQEDKPQPEKPQQEAAAPAGDDAKGDEPAPQGGGQFLWPVKGKVLSGWGPKPDGSHNDGLNIAAAKGTTVVASDGGTVAYAGNELKGFGNLLLIRHANGWMTAYAHLDKLNVERGAKVRRGQAIGTVGQSGSVDAPQLHFEIRKGSQAVDPNGHM